MPIVDYAVPAYYIIACAEASSNLSRYDGIKYGHRTKNAQNLTETYYKSRSEGFGTEVKRRIMLGSFVLSSGYFDAYYKKALKVRGLIKKAFEEAFEKYDMILSPVSPTAAYKNRRTDRGSYRYVYGGYLYGFRQSGRTSGDFPFRADLQKKGCRWACSSSETRLKKRNSSAWPTHISR